LADHWAGARRRFIVVRATRATPGANGGSGIKSWDSSADASVAVSPEKRTGMWISTAVVLQSCPEKRKGPANRGSALKEDVNSVTGG
jgi:hypothetical protein